MMLALLIIGIWCGAGAVLALLLGPAMALCEAHSLRSRPRQLHAAMTRPDRRDLAA